MNKNNQNKTVSYGERIARLEVSVVNLTLIINDIKDNHLTAINKKLDKINELFQSRPPLWASVIITILTSMNVGLLVLYLTAISKI